MIKFVSIAIGGFFRVLRLTPLKTIDCHDMTDILLKVALNTITLNPELPTNKKTMI